jgi:hypothetical protein
MESSRSNRAGLGARRSAPTSEKAGQPLSRSTVPSEHSSHTNHQLTNMSDATTPKNPRVFFDIAINGNAAGR